MTTIIAEQSRIKTLSTSGHRPHEIAAQIIRFLQDETKPEADIVSLVSAWHSARGCFVVLTQNGYRLEAFIPIIDEVLNLASRLARRELIRRILLGRLSDAETDQIIAVLSDEPESEVLADIDHVEAKLSAQREA
jgi:hypothetical protein